MKELAMTEDQYRKMMYEVKTNHAFGGYHPNHSELQKKCNKYIKYVRPDWDMRDGMCFSITFNGMGCGSNGKRFGSGYGETVPLYDQIIKWLNTPREDAPAILSNHGRGA